MTSTFMPKHLESRAALSDLKSKGAHIFGEILDKAQVEALHQEMMSSREFGSGLFMDEAEYLLQENHLNSNPSKTFNFLNAFETQLKIVEENSLIREVITASLGEDYEIVIKKAVCGVPDSWLPGWVRSRIENVHVANLGPYMKQQFRDITYFRGIDFHQDIIDWPKGKSDLDPSKFLTLYVYLHDVTEFDSPLHLIPGTHQRGATLFPHALNRLGPNTWAYSDDGGFETVCQEKILTGGPGYAAIWHNCTLHGTMPIVDSSERYRLSLRYLIGKSRNNTSRTYIDEINESVTGELRPIRTRQDLDDKGMAAVRGSNIKST